MHAACGATSNGITRSSRGAGSWLASGSGGGVARFALGVAVSAWKCSRSPGTTRVHAEMLFDVVAARLGGAAWVETCNGGTRRFLFRRAAPGSTVVPWPLVTLDLRGRVGLVVTIAGPEGEPPPRTGRVPKLRNLGPGEVTLHDGGESVTVTYGDDGRWKECTRGGPPSVLHGVLDALAPKSAMPAELVAAFVTGLDVARHGPGRVHLPAPLPGGAVGAWGRGLSALREALFEARIPWDARWVAVDGFVGTAVAWGGTGEAALAAWKETVEWVKPRPPTPRAPPAPSPEEGVEVASDPEGGGFGVAVTMRGPSSDVEMPEASPETTPAVLVPLPPRPERDPPLGEWRRLVGGKGATGVFALRRDEGGFTLVDERCSGRRASTPSTVTSRWRRSTTAPSRRRRSACPRASSCRPASRPRRGRRRTTSCARSATWTRRPASRTRRARPRRRAAPDSTRGGWTPTICGVAPCSRGGCAPERGRGRGASAPQREPCSRPLTPLEGSRHPPAPRRPREADASASRLEPEKSS